MSDGDAVIRVVRTTYYADRLRAYRVLIDGREATRIRAGRSVDIPVAAGSHSVVIKVDWCGSPTIDCRVNSGETILLHCGSNLRGWRVFLNLIYITFLRNQYLTLSTVREITVA